MLDDRQIALYTETYIDTVYRVALSYVKNPADAEDVTQEVFLALLRTRPDFTCEDHAKFWLIRVTVNACKKLFRSPRRKEIPLEEYVQSLPFREPSHSDLFLAVMSLPMKYRMPLYLHYYEEYSTQEIAELLKIPKGTVCTNLKRGRETLKELLKEEGHDESQSI